jgi:hypothetical protein
MKAMLEPRMVAAKTHGWARAAQPDVSGIGSCHPPKASDSIQFLNQKPGNLGIPTDSAKFNPALEGRAALPWDAEQAIALLAELWGEPVPSVRAQISNNLRHLAEST